MVSKNRSTTRQKTSMTPDTSSPPREPSAADPALKERKMKVKMKDRRRVLVWVR